MDKKCTNPRLGEMIGMYEFGGLDQSDKATFLGHVVECEHCHEQAYSMEPFAIVFRNHRAAVQRNQTFVPALHAPSSSGWNVFSWAFQRGLPLTVSASLLVLVAFVIWRAPWKPTSHDDVAISQPNAGSASDSRWADIKVPKPGYTAPETTVLLREPDRIFARAMSAYQRDDFDVAIEELQILSEMQPGNIGEVRFYEGASLLLIGRSHDAIAALRRAVEVGDGGQVEKSRYYLALAYLKRDQPQQAIAEVEAVIESGGEYVAAAKQLREQISDISYKN